MLGLPITTVFGMIGMRREGPLFVTHSFPEASAAPYHPAARPRAGMESRAKLYSSGHRFGGSPILPGDGGRLAIAARPRARRAYVGADPRRPPSHGLVPPPTRKTQRLGTKSAVVDYPSPRPWRRHPLPRRGDSVSNNCWLDDPRRSELVDLALGQAQEARQDLVGVLAEKRRWQDSRAGCLAEANGHAHHGDGAGLGMR